MRKIKNIILSSFLFLWCNNLYALEFGDLSVYSESNQNLNLTVDIISATADEIATLEVGFASSSDYRKVGMVYPYNTQQYRFDVLQQKDGYYVAITTEQPILDSFLHILLDASWSGGRVLREYTALLSVPVFTDKTESVVISLPTSDEPTIQQSAAQQTQSQIISLPEPIIEPDIEIESQPEPQSESQPEPESEPQPEPQPEIEPELQPESQSELGPVTESADEAQSEVAEAIENNTERNPEQFVDSTQQQIQVVRGDTLSELVTQLDLSGSSAFSAYQAILEANSQSFIDGNMHQLLAGATLIIPNKSRIDSYSDREARNLFVRQAEQHRQSRQNRGASVGGEDISDATTTTATTDSESNLQISQSINEESLVAALAELNIDALLSEIEKQNETSLSLAAEGEQIRQVLQDQQQRADQAAELLRIEAPELAQIDQDVTSQDTQTATAPADEVVSDEVNSVTRDNNSESDSDVVILIVLLILLAGVLIVIFNRKVADKSVKKLIDDSEEVEEIEQAEAASAVTNTALQLARVYLEQGQIDAGKTFVLEVLKDGSKEQKEAAHVLIEKFDLSDLLEK